jgi:hypothetical protein
MLSTFKKRIVPIAGRGQTFNCICNYPMFSLRAQGLGMGCPLCHAHCGELHEITLTVAGVRGHFPAIAVEHGIDDHWCASIREARQCWIALLLGDTA